MVNGLTGLRLFGWRLTFSCITSLNRALSAFCAVVGMFCFGRKELGIPDQRTISGLSLSSAAPSFANIFMGWFEDTHIYTYHLQPIMWKRYIDDIFIIWQHGEEELRKFINYLNDKHDSIKFT